GFIYVISFSVVALIGNYFIPTPYNTFINIMAFPILVYFILKTNALKAILAEITFYIIILCIGTPLVALYNFIFGSTSNTLLNLPLHKIAYSLILYIILFIIYKILKKFN